MAEISREDAIHQIGEWYGGFAKKPSEDAIHKAISDMEKLEKIEQNLQHIDLAIRCAMCTNIMANDQGCDGGCRINESMYKAVLDIIDKEIEQILRG